MISKIILTTLLTLFLAGICSSAEFNYTWKDAEGNLFITDYPPPDGVEIIDISIIPVPAPQQLAPVQQQVEQPGQDEIRSRLEAEAAALRKEETALRYKAAGLAEEAEEQRRIGKKRHYKERYQRRAGIKDREAEELVRQADALAGKAESLERQASELK
jgi:hypothetical protein